MKRNAGDIVFVVPLGAGTPNWSRISWRDIVNERRRYFHPIGGRWPKNSVESIGFRYDGRLQSIHRIEHVDRIECRSEFAKFFPEIDGEACRLAYDGGKPVPHFIYSLSAPTIPGHIVRSGSVVMAMHVWADRELLLSSDSISDAVELTKQQNLSHGSSTHGDERVSLAAHVPSPSFILPPIVDAESLMERIRLLPGLPERNHEDVVRELLVRLGHDPSSIVFQRGRIDISVVNHEQKELMVFEVKRSIADETKREGALRQVHDYAGRTGAEIFVVTDGDQYIIYDRRKGRSYREMLCGEFRLDSFSARKVLGAGLTSTSKRLMTPKR